MTSIITNTAAMAALQTMRSINSEMETTQNRISSGYKVEKASDNAAYWSIATTMRSDNKALSAVQDALGLGAAKLDIAYTGMKSSIDVVSEIKSKLVAAQDPGVDKTKINTELTELKNQLRSISQSSSFSGENWLNNDSTAAFATKKLVGGFNRDSSGNVSVSTLDVSAADITLIGAKKNTLGILTKDYSAKNYGGTSGKYHLVAVSGNNATSANEIKLTATTSAGTINNMLASVTGMLKDMTKAGATLGAVSKRVTMQNDFMSSLKSSIDKGIGRLVDADMNEESTRLKALQTQQQLSIQALSIANSSSQNILSLFR